MAMARTLAATLVGVTGRLVAVEAHIASGLPAFILVGLPDASLSESRDRVRAAVVNSGQAWPNRRITVGLSPASLPKGGSSFDLGIACAVLSAAGVVPVEPFADTLLLGELGLDGRVRPVRGVLPAVMAAAAGGLARVVVPEANADEARLVPGLEVLGVRSLAQVVARLRGDPEPTDEPARDPSGPSERDVGAVLPPAKDLADVLGQTEGRFALEVCAAGGHNLALMGPPGAGKTMLAERLPGLMPALSRQAALEVTAIHSVAGRLPAGSPLITSPPFQDPHHTATQAAIVGGGSGFPRPGAASLAHRGVLFLDEAPEFSRSVLDALRQPLESGEVVISRSAGTARYPARFTLVLAANPCPCGQNHGKGLDCRCTPQARIRYLGKLSGPLLDRVDVRVDVHPVDRRALLADREFVEATAVVAERVAAARERAAARLAGTPWSTNAEIPGPVLRREWPVPSAVAAVLDKGLATGGLTARGVDRILRVAWTLADLAGRSVPGPAEAGTASLLRLSSASAA